MGSPSRNSLRLDWFFSVLLEPLFLESWHKAWPWSAFFFCVSLRVTSREPPGTPWPSRNKWLPFSCSYLLLAPKARDLKASWFLLVCFCLFVKLFIMINPEKLYAHMWSKLLSWNKHLYFFENKLNFYIHSNGVTFGHVWLFNADWQREWAEWLYFRSAVQCHPLFIYFLSSSLPSNCHLTAAFPVCGQLAFN